MKNYKNVGQNVACKTKHNKQDANLRKNSTLYFQVGLILCLLTSYTLLELEVKKQDISVEYANLVEEIDYTVSSPNFKVEEVKKPIEPLKKAAKNLDNIKIVDNDATTKKLVESLIIEEDIPVSEGISEKDIDVYEIPEDIPVDFYSVEVSPIYPGCEKYSKTDALKQCMSKKIKKLVQKKFNSDLVNELGLTGIHKINVQFKVDKTGAITNVKTRAAHPRLEKEAQKLMTYIPTITPGNHNGKKVGVIYNLPIVIQAKR